MKPLTFKFKFRAPSPAKKPDPLILDFGIDQSAPDVAGMMQDGKMPIPKAYADLMKGELTALGCKHVRFSKKHSARYVDIVARKKGQYDS
jgi:hypothetical protein